MAEVASKGDLVDMFNNPIGPREVKEAYERRDVIKKGVPTPPAQGDEEVAASSGV